MPAKRKPTKRKIEAKRKKRIRPVVQAMTVTRETGRDMAASWVRELARQEIRQILGPLRLEMNHAVLELKRAIVEVVTSEERLQAEMKDLEERAGDFTGLSEAQVSGMISRMVDARVTARVTRRTIDQMFREVIGQFYGSSDHPSFRERFRLDDRRMKEYLQNERHDEAVCQGSD